MNFFLRSIYSISLRNVMCLSLFSCLFFQVETQAQPGIDESTIGAWYMYYFVADFDSSRFGLQGDIQGRFWKPGSDFEQGIGRFGLTFSPRNANIMFTLGYGYVLNGTPGESNATTDESRVYQEALLPQQVGSRFLLTHRFRTEQRWVEASDFRTRFRYSLSLNIPLNGYSLNKKVYYLAFYNELFINGQNVLNGQEIDYFDRNRAYVGAGYGLTNKLRFQLGYLFQTTSSWSKQQLQFGLHQRF